MLKLKVQGIPSEYVEHIRRGGGDANGQSAVTEISTGPGNPCRHCLQVIAKGDGKLILSYRPFDSAQPYAESGPIFLHQSTCTRYEANQLPDWFQFMTPSIIRGYNTKDWIVYETGAVVNGPELTSACQDILTHPEVAYVHIRSRFNCFQCRVERAA